MRNAIAAMHVWWLELGPNGHMAVANVAIAMVMMTALTLWALFAGDLLGHALRVYVAIMAPACGG